VLASELWKRFVVGDTRWIQLWKWCKYKCIHF